MFDVLISAPFEFASPLSSRRQGSSTPVSANPSQFCRLIVNCQPSHATGGDAVFECAMFAFAWNRLPPSREYRTSPQEPPLTLRSARRKFRTRCCDRVDERGLSAEW